MSEKLNKITRYEHISAFERSLPCKTESELRAILGQPALELGGSLKKEEFDGVPTEYTTYTNSLVYYNVTPRIKSFKVHVTTNGRLDFEFECPEFKNGMLNNTETMAKIQLPSGRFWDSSIDPYLYLNAANNNKEMISRSDKCGCISCRRIFLSTEITKWWDNGKTACCPYCRMTNVVIGSASKLVIDEECLTMSGEHWLG